MTPMDFQLTYSTMFDPPEELHTRFEQALQGLRGQLGKSWELSIGGERQEAPLRELRCPADNALVLGHFPEASVGQVAVAMASAHRAQQAWRTVPMGQRCALMRQVASVIERRVFELAAALALEVGKNRMEALGEIQETADFFRMYANDFENHHGYDHLLPDDPLPGYGSHNRSVMKPYGVWVVITPFNYPFALAGGPVAAALVTGNTVVLKGAEQTPWAGCLLQECLAEAGLPTGVFTYLWGPGESVGQALVSHPQVGGITFTGSREVGMALLEGAVRRDWPRPCIAEMGGKNAVIVARGADLERAASGIVRSAFGMGGQKCSALSRIYVDGLLADELVARIREKVTRITVGDPVCREVWLGPLIDAAAKQNFVSCCEELRSAGATFHCGGHTVSEGKFARGHYCAPTLAEVHREHRLWQHEMFAPVALLSRVQGAQEAMTLANGTPFGLTAGFYGAESDVRWFLDNIEAGVTYVNRPQGATTGAWPGYQPFGGWKGSGSTGKAIASFHYLPQYMREQSQTVVD